MQTLGIILAAAWRFWDGSDTGILTRWRNLLGLIIALFCAWVALGPTWWVLWLGAWGACSLIAGHTDWDDWKWMPIRYGAPACVAVSPSWFVGLSGLDLYHSGLMYVGGCVAVGIAYPALMKWGQKLPRWRELDGPEAYARTLAGALVIGGLTAL